MKKYLTILMIFSVAALFGQGYKIGVRAGANYSQYRGPLETAVNEQYKLSGGFHFGFNFTYYVVDKSLGLRLELLYLQNGTKQLINGESYALIKIPNSSFIYKEDGNREQNLDISNAYMSLPLTIQYQINKKFEIFAGGYANFLIGPTAGGKMVFNSRNEETGEGIFYTQSLIYDYNSDTFGDSFGREKRAVINPVVNIDGQDIVIPGAIGAYYFESSEVEGSFINKFDLGLTAGFNFFVNRGFYLGTRINYGFRDITNTRYDFSYEKLSDENDFIPRNDEDKLIGFDVSLGFRF